jgi:formylglycine-generating enzyme required for sulfatase activity
MNRRLNMLTAVGGLGMLAAVVVYFAFRLGNSPPSPAPPTPPSLFPKGGDSGGSWQNPIDGATYRWIPPGVFMMGCSPTDSGCFYDHGEPPHPQVSRTAWGYGEPAHKERVANGFWLAQTEVTQAAWKKLKLNGGDNPSQPKGDDLPVNYVDWIRADFYCKAIGGRLPTQKEWEYAARAGSTGSYYGNPDDIEWHWSNSGGMPNSDGTIRGGAIHPVGLKQPNIFGLYDMLGNIAEWVSEPGHARGGSVMAWDADPSVHHKIATSTNFGTYDIGFRCAGGVP